MATHEPVRFGLVIVGDEILSGKREDKHLNKMIELLRVRGLQLAWSHYIGDDRDALVELYRRTFAAGDTIISCGGIGATPDDHTGKPPLLRLKYRSSFIPRCCPGPSAAPRGAQGTRQRGHEHPGEQAAAQNGRVSVGRGDHSKSV